jgi:hypothetical protein
LYSSEVACIVSAEWKKKHTSLRKLMLARIELSEEHYVLRGIVHEVSEDLFLGLGTDLKRYIAFLQLIRASFSCSLQSSS